MVTLTDDDPDIFAGYLHWLYRGTLPVMWGNPDRDELQLWRLAKSLILGDMLMADDYVDAVLDTIILGCSSPNAIGEKRLPTMAVVQHIYENSLHGSLFRDMMRDLYSRAGATDQIGRTISGTL
jgi:hypothetical protein